jgi:hypothetical protein
MEGTPPDGGAAETGAVRELATPGIVLWSVRNIACICSGVSAATCCANPAVDKGALSGVGFVMVGKAGGGVGACV